MNQSKLIGIFRVKFIMKGMKKSIKSIPLFIFSLSRSKMQGGNKHRAITAAVVQLIRPKKELLGDKRAQRRSRVLDI